MIWLQRGDERCSSDSPGHAYAWGVGYPGITVCPNYVPYMLYCLQVRSSPAPDLMRVLR